MNHTRKNEFSGLTVLDLSRYLPGGYATQVLADMGAEVIKVEDTGRGDFCRHDEPVMQGESYYFTALARNKKSLSVNLKSREGKEIFHKLAAKSDIILESFRPGVTARLGIDYEQIKAVKPDIIYCSLSGYGQLNPNSLKALHDINMQAQSGYLSLNGGKTSPLHLCDLAVMDRVAGLKHAVFLDSLGPVKGGFTTYREILETYDPLPREEYGLMDGLEVALILGTSGTTGSNKGVMLTHSNIIFSEEQFNLELGLDENDIMFMPAPLNHATGFHHGIIAPMLLGAKVVLQQKFKCPEAIHIMNREKCTYSMGSTPFIYDILKYLEKEGGSLESLKFYLCGGAPVPEDMVLRASAFGICLCEVYGSTESVPHVFVRPWETLTRKERTSGRPLEGIQVRVVDEQGREVPPGIVGEEISRGPNVFVGYLKDREETDRVLTDDGWFYSGDLCVMDEAGNIRIVGRKKDMIVRGGENLNSNYIDEALEGCPGVADHAVIGMPDERLGERICAYVVPEQGVCVGLDQVLSYMKEKHVPKRYWPERLEQIKEIPRTGSGKVKKYLLLEDLKKRG